MKKILTKTTAVSFVLASTLLMGTAGAGTLKTLNVIGFDGDMDPIYGTVKSDVKTLKVLGYDSNLDPIYGDAKGTIKTQKVIGFDDDMDPIYQQ